MKEDDTGCSKVYYDHAGAELIEIERTKGTIGPCIGIPEKICKGGNQAGVHLLFVVEKGTGQARLGP